ncbi:MAG TPA: phospholipase [Porphyromonadaceae bacterium]|nr:phospholipase [Porphyromonadaceae bacterium]
MISLILLCALFLLGVILFFVEYLKSHFSKKEGISTPMESSQQEEPVCCGQHAVCEKDSLLSALSKEIEYYNDEELDAYKNLLPEEYPQKALDEFAEVFYTLREEEVAGWVRSLQLRHIELPPSLKEEVLLVLAESRMGNTQSM